MTLKSQIQQLHEKATTEPHLHGADLTEAGLDYCKACYAASQRDEVLRNAVPEILAALERLERAEAGLRKVKQIVVESIIDRDTEIYICNVIRESMTGEK